MIGTKRCTKCGLEKTLDEFNQDKRERDGHRRWCRSCTKEYQVNLRAGEVPTVGPFKCQGCGKEFRIKLSAARSKRANGKFPPKYCSSECYKESRRRDALPSAMGPFTCQHCGAEFYITAQPTRSKVSSGKYSPKYCSKECHYFSRSGGGPSRRMKVCNILSAHHNTLKDDPDHLSTDFLKSLIGGVATNCEGSE